MSNNQQNSNRIWIKLFVLIFLLIGSNRIHDDWDVRAEELEEPNVSDASSAIEKNSSHPNQIEEKKQIKPKTFFKFAPATVELKPANSPPSPIKSQTVQTNIPQKTQRESETLKSTATQQQWFPKAAPQTNNQDPKAAQQTNNREIKAGTSHFKFEIKTPQTLPTLQGSEQGQTPPQAALESPSQNNPLIPHSSTLGSTPNPTPPKTDASLLKAGPPQPNPKILPRWTKQLKIDPSRLPSQTPEAQKTSINWAQNQSREKEFGDRPFIPLPDRILRSRPQAPSPGPLPNLRNISVRTRMNKAFYASPRSLREYLRVPNKNSVALKLRRSLASPQGKPTHGFVFISSLFGKRPNPFGRGVEFHNGVDLVGAKGLPILATAEGRVSPRKRNRAYGVHVIIDHGFGYKTLYAHLSRKRVKANQYVKRGQILGFMGSTGRSTGPHLHYSVYLDRQAVDPKPYLFK